MDGIEGLLDQCFPATFHMKSSDAARSLGPLLKDNHSLDPFNLNQTLFENAFNECVELLSL